MERFSAYPPSGCAGRRAGKSKGLKLRFLAMGCIISGLGVILLGSRGFATSYVGLLTVGLVLLVLGIVWK